MSAETFDPAHAFAGLPLFGFDLIMADPPWPFRLWSENGWRKSPQAHYPTMPIADIAALPVGHLLAKDGLVWLWGTFPLLLDGGDPSFSPIGSVLKGWGLRYVTGGSWHKTTRNGKAAFGGGFVFRSAAEPFVIGATGAPKTAKSVRNALETFADGNGVKGIRREHSRKPDDAYQMAEALMPKARRLDLFSREDRPGWTSWGLEAGKFNRSAA